VRAPIPELKARPFARRVVDALERRLDGKAAELPARVGEPRFGGWLAAETFAAVTSARGLFPDVGPDVDQALATGTPRYWWERERGGVDLLFGEAGDDGAIGFEFHVLRSDAAWWEACAAVWNDLLAPPASQRTSSLPLDRRFAVLAEVYRHASGPDRAAWWGGVERDLGRVTDPDGAHLALVATTHGWTLGGPDGAEDRVRLHLVGVRAPGA
jgi:hypothetical protein